MKWMCGSTKRQCDRTPLWAAAWQASAALNAAYAALKDPLRRAEHLLELQVARHLVQGGVAQGDTVMMHCH